MSHIFFGYEFTRLTIYSYQMENKDFKEAPAHLVTSVGESLTKDQSIRQRKYFVSMMIRTICFIAAVILPSPWRWLALFGAVTLPYIAVIAANAGRETIKGQAIYTGKYKELN